MRRVLAFVVLMLAVLPDFYSAACANDAHSLRCKNGAVVSVSGPASEAGAAILKRGGHAVDAAVATAFALAVTHPAAGNIGGGGYLLLAPSAGEPIVFDFREVAPAAATTEMFVKPEDRAAHRRVGVPGTVRGLALAHTRYGKLPWRELVQPAVELARDGFVLDRWSADSLNQLLKTSETKQFAELHRVFGKPGGGKWAAGDRLVQPDLAKTLQRIADNGADEFYLGKTAELLAEEMRLGKGLISKADLAAYSPVVRKPVFGTYRGHEIIGVPPSSSGGTVLIQTLNILENFKLDEDRYTPRNIHLIVEAMKRSYRDRARYLGDPAFNEIPAKLLSKEYAKELAAGINPEKATPSKELAGDIPITQESEQTTHFSVVDKDRNAISLTYTLEQSYGSRVVVRGAGFILNDEMNDFGWLPGVTNTQGRIGTPPNLIAPGKRMVSSMTPTIIRKDGKLLLVTGSPGGRTIICTVICVVTNFIDFKMSLRDAVDAPRLHHQWFPDSVRQEAGLLKDRSALRTKLEAMGHLFQPPREQGDAHSIAIDPATGELNAVADQRIWGVAAGY